MNLGPNTIASTYQYVLNLSGGHVTFGDGTDASYLSLGASTNSVSSTNSSILGGNTNTIAVSNNSVIVAGGSNSMTSGQFGFIGAGYSNSISTTDGSIGYFSIVGGYGNKMNIAPYSFIGGGVNNLISGISVNTNSSSIVGGNNNKITGATYYSFIGGGNSNSIIAGYIPRSYSNIVGGGNNLISGASSSILGGANNIISGSYASIIGGNNNKAIGDYSNVLGGNFNASSGNYSNTLGYNSIATNAGSTVFSDGDSTRNKYSNGINSLTLDYIGGTFISGTTTFLNNPLIGSANFILNTGDQNISGTKNFYIRPTVNGSGVLLVGEASSSSSLNTVYTSGTQTITGAKDFSGVGNLPTYQGSGFALAANLITTGQQIGSLSGSVVFASGGTQSITGLKTFINNLSFNASLSGQGPINFGTSNSYYTVSTNSSILGGSNNYLSGLNSILGAGTNNRLYGDNAVIGGGYSNTISGLLPSTNYSAILGGNTNSIIGSYGFIAGGNTNYLSGDYNSIVGGYNHTISGQKNFIGAGGVGIISGNASNIVGGDNNNITGTYSNILGGSINNIASNYSSILGGSNNITSGDYSLGFGYNINILSGHTGAAVLSDSQNRTHTSKGAHTINLDYSSGTYTSGLYSSFGSFSLSGVQPNILLPNNPLSVSAGGNTYIQATVQNTLTGTSASSDFIATRSNGTDSIGYLDLGINNSGYADSNYSIGTGYDGYLYINGGNLAIGTQTPNKNIYYHVGGTTIDKKIVEITPSGLNLTSGNLTVNNTGVLLSGNNLFAVRMGHTTTAAAGLVSLPSINFFGVSTMSLVTSQNITGYKRSIPFSEPCIIKKISWMHSQGTTGNLGYINNTGYVINLTKNTSGLAIMPWSKSSSTATSPDGVTGDPVYYTGPISPVVNVSAGDNIVFGLALPVYSTLPNNVDDLVDLYCYG